MFVVMLSFLFVKEKTDCTYSRFSGGMSNEAAMLMRVGRQCRWWLWE